MFQWLVGGDPAVAFLRVATLTLVLLSFLVLVVSLLF